MTEEPVSAIIHLGSNIGNRSHFLSEALEHLKGLGDLVHVSSVYETAPWGNQEQQYFLNQAAELSTSLSPGDLMSALLEIEEKMGRQRTQKWGPRSIDLDIVFYGDQIIEQKELTIPHPQMHTRAFVLIPLLEICPDREHPVIKKTIWELYDECPDLSEVYLPDVPL
jgi:2-amino-4-hydroxy-6-hydroxymethyldihydropteridine diphosphokinase